MASFRDPKHELKSVAWDHFVKRDTVKKLAECLYCKELISYFSTSANLLSHLKRKHNLKKEPSCAAADKEKLLETEYWEYFVRDERFQQATCKLCSEEVDYEESSMAPLDHIKSKHISEINEVNTSMVTKEKENGTDDDNGGSDDNIIDVRATPKMRNKTSIAWEYFDIEDDEDRMARCKLCGDIRSYRSTVTNLIRHINRRHANCETESAISSKPDTIAGAIVGANDSIAETDAEDNAERRRRSTIWLYFKCVDRSAKKAQCLICKRTFSYATTMTNLKSHLRRIHPHLNVDETKTILLSSGGELFEVETDKNGDLNGDQHEPEEMDTVYLDDFDTLENPPRQRQTYRTPPRREQKHKQRTRLQTINLHESSSDDEPIQSLRKNQKSDSIDHFGKYAVSLLRELPKEISNKLQSDFISRIMDAHLTYESQKLVHARAQADAQSNAYSITVTTVDNTRLQEPEGTVVAEVVQSETQSQECS